MIYSIDLDINHDGDFDHLTLDSFEISTDFKPFVNLGTQKFIESLITANKNFDVLFCSPDNENEIRVLFGMSDMPHIDSDRRLVDEISNLNEEVTSLFPNEFILKYFKINYIINSIG